MFRYRLIRLAMRLTQFFLLGTIHVQGRENIPASGPYIVVLNHVSVADTPILLITFPLVRWRFFASEKWRTHWLFGPIMTWLGAIYINQGEADRRALKEALDALQAGAVFGLAPEGSRSQGGQMRVARDGAAYLASRSKVQVLPVGLVNLDVLFANVRRLRPTTVEVHIGQPFIVPEIGRRVRSGDLAAYTHLIMCHIAALLPERYHGHYAHSPALRALQRGEDPWPYCFESMS
jgi:1-acyl-sn-glycerol-3-phosphate acyltransferase